MSVEAKRLRNITWVVNTGLLGGVVPDYSSPLTDGVPETDYKADIYTAWGEPDTISFEDARERTLAIQEGLDKEIVEENIFGSEPPLRNGRPPCLRVRANGHS